MSEPQTDGQKKGGGEAEAGGRQIQGIEQKGKRKKGIDEEYENSGGEEQVGGGCQGAGEGRYTNTSQCAALQTSAFGKKTNYLYFFI